MGEREKVLFEDHPGNSCTSLIKWGIAKMGYFVHALQVFTDNFTQNSVPFSM